jgi:hypothetical protein
MIAIGDIILHILYNNNNNNWKMYVVTHWTTIIGPLASRVCIEKIEHDTIVLGVCDSAWLQELSTLSEILLHKINQALPTPTLKKIRFKHARTPQITSKKIITHTPLIKTIRPLSIKEQSALQAISDQELSAALQQFLVRCQQISNH